MNKVPLRRDMRRYDRLAAEFPVTVRTGGEMVKGGIRLNLADLSEGGAFIHSDLLLELGQQIQIEIDLTSTVIKATGHVVRVSQNAAKNPGMGIEFLDLNEQDRKILKTQLETMITTASGATTAK